MYAPAKLTKPVTGRISHQRHEVKASLKAVCHTHVWPYRTFTFVQAASGMGVIQRQLALSAACETEEVDPTADVHSIQVHTNCTYIGGVTHVLKVLSLCL